MTAALKISRALAIFAGIVTPGLETYRRWDTWQNDPPAFFDDYILGGLLLFGAWRITKDTVSGQKFLTAGWGFALAMVYMSFFFQLGQVGTVANDPSGFPTATAVAVKGIGFILILIGFITSLVSVPEQK